MTAQSPVSAPSAPRARIARLAARLSRADGGATAVEFALIALPFFALLFGILELAMIFILSTSLDNAAQTAARTIRTGQLQIAGGASAATFKTTVCNNLGWLATDCSNSLEVDVRTYPTFSAITLGDPITNKTFNKSSLQFVPGGPGDIVLVRAYYQWTLISPLLSKAVEKLNGGKTLVTSTLAFRNEPFGT